MRRRRSASINSSTPRSRASFDARARARVLEPGLSRPRILIYRPVDESGASHDALAAAGCDVVVAKPGADRPEIERLARDADALLGATFRGVIDRDLLSISPSL